MIDHLRAAAAQRRRDAEERVTQAMRTMSRDGEAINFAAVARKAAVSTDFLYRHPRFRARILDLRSSGSGKFVASAPTADFSAADTSSAVRCLATQLKELLARHQNEVAPLETALAAAHGENLRLRRLLANRLQSA